MNICQCRQSDFFINQNSHLTNNTDLFSVTGVPDFSHTSYCFSVICSGSFELEIFLEQCKRFWEKHFGLSSYTSSVQLLAPLTTALLCQQLKHKLTWKCVALLSFSCWNKSGYTRRSMGITQLHWNYSVNFLCLEAYRLTSEDLFAFNKKFSFWSFHGSL